MIQEILSGLMPHLEPYIEVFVAAFLAALARDFFGAPQQNPHPVDGEGGDGAGPYNLAHVEDRDAFGVDKRGDLAAVDGVFGVVPAVSVENLTGLRQFLNALGCGEPIPRGSSGARLESPEERELWAHA
jgi:hypothetical protein